MTRISLHTILVLVCVGRTGLANPVIKSTAVKASDLPAGVTVRGDFQSGLKFTDRNGTNYLLFGRSSDQKKNSAMLFVEDWVVPAKGPPRNLLPVRDFVEPCEMGGVTARFHDAARMITDLDGDGIAEVTRNNAEVTIAGDCAEVDVAATNTLVHVGAVETLTVTGSISKVQASRVAKIVFRGDGNIVVAPGESAVEDHGKDNKHIAG